LPDAPFTVVVAAAPPVAVAKLPKLDGLPAVVV